MFKAVVENEEVRPDGAFAGRRDLLRAVIDPFYLNRALARNHDRRDISVFLRETRGLPARLVQQFLDRIRPAVYVHEVLAELDITAVYLCRVDILAVGHISEVIRVAAALLDQVELAAYLDRAVRNGFRHVHPFKGRGLPHRVDVNVV